LEPYVFAWFERPSQSQLNLCVAGYHSLADSLDHWRKVYTSLLEDGSSDSNVSSHLNPLRMLNTRKQQIDDICNKFERQLGLAHSAGAELLKAEPVPSSAKSTSEGATSQVLEATSSAYGSASNLYSKFANSVDGDSQPISATAVPSEIGEMSSGVLAQVRDAVGSAYESGHEAVDATFGEAGQRIFSVAASDTEADTTTSEDATIDYLGLHETTDGAVDNSAQPDEADTVEFLSSLEDSTEANPLHRAAPSSISEVHASVLTESIVAEDAVIDNAATSASAVSDNESGDDVSAAHATVHLRDDAEESKFTATADSSGVTFQNDKPDGSVSHSTSQTTVRDEL
jgi:hypothetical protein